MAVSIGYGRKEMAEAAAAALQEVSYVLPVFASEARIELVKRIKKLLPEELRNVYLCSGGSEANEAAIKLARQYQVLAGRESRYKVISRNLSYHGMTFLTLSIGDVKMRQRDLLPTLWENPRVEASYCYRCPFGKESPGCDIDCALQVEERILAEGPDTVVAFIAEPIVAAAGGALVPPPEYFPIVRETCDKYDVVSIAGHPVPGGIHWSHTLGFLQVHLRRVRVEPHGVLDGIVGQRGARRLAGSALGPVGRPVWSARCRAGGGRHRGPEHGAAQQHAEHAGGLPALHPPRLWSRREVTGPRQHRALPVVQAPQGMAIGITLVGAGVGGVVLAPMASLLDRGFGWRTGYLIQAVGICFLIGLETLGPIVLIGFIIVFGCSYGGGLSLAPLLIAESFGIDSMGVIFGALGIVAMEGGALGGRSESYAGCPVSLRTRKRMVPTTHQSTAV
jgi:hypothetical protein